MSPVVIYVLIRETKEVMGEERERKERGGGGGRELSTHYVTSHPCTHEREKSTPQK
jgi:hypothetical protein